MMISAVERDSAANDAIIPRPTLAYGGVRIIPIMKPPIVEQAMAMNSSMALYFHAITAETAIAMTISVIGLSPKSGVLLGVGTGGS